MILLKTLVRYLSILFKPQNLLSNSELLIIHKEAYVYKLRIIKEILKFSYDIFW